MRLAYPVLLAVLIALPAAAQPIIIPLTPQRSDPPPPPAPSPVPVAPPQADPMVAPDTGARSPAPPAEDQAPPPAEGRTRNSDQ